MTDYKSIVGKGIRSVTANLDNDQAEGQIWYNSTDGVFRNVISSGAFASSANMIEKSRLMAGFGIQTAAVSAGGNTDTANIATTQHYNGTGWDLGGNLPEARFNAGGLGVETAGMSVGGGDPPGARSIKTFEYNGSAWTAGGNLSEEREGPFSFGTETAGVAAGGETLLPPGVSVAATVDEYNGSSWTAVNSMSNARYLGAACGTETAGVVFGGYGGSSYITATELYDGTNWTAGGNTPSTQKYAQAASGQQTDALLINGYVTAYTTDVTEYNGSTFTAGQSTAIARSQLGASKQQANTTNALAYGGVNPGFSGGPRISNTEEFNVSTNVTTGAAWASGGNLGTARRFIDGAGASQTAGIAFGGWKPGAADETELYDGTSWTEVNNMGTAQYGSLCGGTQTARRQGGGAGTVTAGLVMGGRPPDAGVSNTEEYDGTNWTNGGTLNQSARQNSGAGTQTAGLNFGGSSDPVTPADLGNTEEYNGTAWTASATMNHARSDMAQFSASTQTAGIAFGGTPPITGNTEFYDGTSWITSASMATARRQLAGGGTQTDALAFGGQAPPESNATEEFTPESTSLNIKTITTS